MKRAQTSVLLAALFLGRAPAAPAADLQKLVGGSDIVVHGQVVRIAEGKEDLELLKMGIRFRTDIATILVLEVLRGDSTLKKVEVGFPGFPKDGELTPARNQNGLWFLTKSDVPYYVAKSKDCFAQVERLGDVRRAIRAVAGLEENEPDPADRAKRLAELSGQLGAGEFAGARRLAAYQLGEMGELDALPALIHALGDDEPSVRLAADLALTKITGHRAQIDFENAEPAMRARGMMAWQEWREQHKDQARKKVLQDAAEASLRPQPDFVSSVKALAEYDDPSLLPLFTQTLDSALNAQDSVLTAAAARYLGRIKNRDSAGKLAGVVDGTFAWPSLSARSAAAAAIGQIVGQDFGTGSAAVDNCAKWWQENGTEF